MNGPRRLLEVWVAGGALAGVLHAQEPASPVPTNLRVYQMLAQGLADSLAPAVAGEDSPRVSVRISPPDFAWFLQDPVERPFRGRRCVIRAGDSARYGVEFGTLAMNVRYANLRTEGLFGSRVMDRTIVLVAQTRIVDRQNSWIITTREQKADFTDTIGLSHLEEIEQPGIPLTRATVPPEGFFSGVAEPLIIVSAVAVAIFLLFTVRS